MKMWNKIYFNKQNIKKETDTAILISMPSKSNYANYSFWHPAKLVREEGGKGYFLSFSFTDGWTFKLKTKTRELNVNQDVIIKAFGLVHEEISSGVKKDK